MSSVRVRLQASLVLLLHGSPSRQVVRRPGLLSRRVLPVLALLRLLRLRHLQVLQAGRVHRRATLRCRRQIHLHLRVHPASVLPARRSRPALQVLRAIPTRRVFHLQAFRAPRALPTVTRHRAFPAHRRVIVHPAHRQAAFQARQAVPHLAHRRPVFRLPRLSLQFLILSMGSHILLRSQ